MSSLAEIVAWRDALFSARLSGIREVQDQNGERVVYRSDTEMAAALAAAERAIAGASARAPHTIRFSTSKGI